MHPNTRPLSHTNGLSLLVLCLVALCFIAQGACSSPSTQEGTTERRAGQEAGTDAAIVPEKRTPEAASLEAASDASPDLGLADAQKPVSERGTEPQTEPVPDAQQKEAFAEPTPERPQPPEKGLTQGACQAKSPRCAPDYQCRDDVKPALCHLRCDLDNPTCPGNTLCLALSTGEGICVQGTPAKETEACDTQRICGTGLVCVLTNPPKGTCYRRCTLKQPQCKADEYCFLVHSKNGVCLKGSYGPKKAGEACKRTPECAKGLLCFAPFQQSLRCAALCDADHPCPRGERCAPLKDAPKGAGACTKS